MKSEKEMREKTDYRRVSRIKGECGKCARGRGKGDPEERARIYRPGGMYSRDGEDRNSFDFLNRGSGGLYTSRSVPGAALAATSPWVSELLRCK